MVPEKKKTRLSSKLGELLCENSKSSPSQTGQEKKKQKEEKKTARHQANQELVEKRNKEKKDNKVTALGRARKKNGLKITNNS